MFDWKETLKKVAPIAGAMIGGPFGGIAAQAITAVLGQDGDKPMTEQEMAIAIEGATPEQLIQLKSIDANLKVTLKKLDIKEDEIHAGDRDSARKMQIITKSNIPATLVITLTVAVLIIAICLLRYAIPTTNEAVIYMMLGAVLAKWGDAVNFFVGTSKSSQSKTELLSRK